MINFTNFETIQNNTVISKTQATIFLFSSQQATSLTSSEQIDNKVDAKAVDDGKEPELVDDKSNDKYSSEKDNNANTNIAMEKLNEPIISIPIIVPYLSPLVLRKELENMLEAGEGAMLMGHVKIEGNEDQLRYIHV